MSNSSANVPISTNATAAKANADLVQRKKFSWHNIGIGAGIQVFEVSTLGQPFEVIKTHMAGKGVVVVVVVSVCLSELI